MCEQLSVYVFTTIFFRDAIEFINWGSRSVRTVVSVPKKKVGLLFSV